MNALLSNIIGGAIIAGLLTLALVLLYEPLGWSVKDQMEACAAKDGIYLQTFSDKVCIRKSAVITLEE